MSTATVSHGKINLLIAEADSRDWRDKILQRVQYMSEHLQKGKTYRSTRQESLNNPDFLPCLFDFEHCEVSLDYFQLLDIGG